MIVTLRLLGLMIWISGCASGPSLSHHLRQPATREILNSVNFVPQDQKLCGPVVLKMANEYHQPARPLSDYKNLVYLEKLEGTLKTDLLAGARRLGLSPYAVPTVATMLEQVEHHQPVVVFQNLGLSWLPAWHYSLLVGFHSGKNLVYVHGGNKPYEALSFDRFVSTWRRGGEWAYVLVPASQVPSHAPFEEALDNGIVFERLEKTDQALELYSAMANRWPERFEPHLGRAQIFYQRGRHHQALVEIQAGLRKSPAHPALLFNLAELYHELGRRGKALHLKRQLLASLPMGQREIFQRKFTF